MKKAHLISLFIGFSGFVGSNLLMAQESWQSQLVTQDKTGNLNDLLLTLKDSNVSVDYLCYHHGDEASYQEACRSIKESNVDAVLIAPLMW